jgi:hypothetical protein
MTTTVDSILAEVKEDYKKNFGRDATPEDLDKHKQRLEKNLAKYPTPGGLIPEDAARAYSQKELSSMDKSKSVKPTGGAGMGGSGVDVEGLKMNKNLKPKMASGGKVGYKSGGKVAGKLATRGYGCVKK